MVVDCKIYKSYKDDIKSLKCPEFDFMTALLRGQGYPTLLRIFLRFGIIRYCVPFSALMLSIGISSSAFSSFCAKGKPNASVLPLPVSAAANPNVC